MSGLLGFGRRKTAPERTRDALTGTKKTKIKELIGRCEFCREPMEVHQLDIHHIDEACNADGSSDKNTPANLIVVCSFCHNEYHRAKTITKTEFKARVKMRSKTMKSKLRAILKDRIIVVDDDNGRSAGSRLKKICSSHPGDSPFAFGLTPLLFGNSKKKRR
jgi:galactitol-specific phosphotransferase system IIB component